MRKNRLDEIGQTRAIWNTCVRSLPQICDREPVSSHISTYSYKYISSVIYYPISFILRYSKMAKKCNYTNKSIESNLHVSKSSTILKLAPAKYQTSGNPNSYNNKPTLRKNSGCFIVVKRWSRLTNWMEMKTSLLKR